MKRKDKNGRSDLKGFLSYREDNLSRPEKNAFEKKLQKDPFAAEAEEGFSLLQAQEIRKDMELLNKRIKSKASGKRPVNLYYRIAASIAVLMVISTVFIITQKNKPSLQEKIADSQIIIPAPSPALTKPGEKAEQKSGKAAETGKTTPGASDEKAKEGPVTTGKKTETEVIRETVAAAEYDLLGEKQDIIIEETKNEVKDLTLESGASADPSVSNAGEAEKAYAAPVASEIASRRDISEDIAGAPAKKAVSYDGYLPPEPLPGQKKFDSYIEKNIKIPASQIPGSSEVVELSFIVRMNGTPDSIKIISSPGKDYSDEAVRLIRQGPGWKPAMLNGNQAEESVKLKIIFR